MFMHTYVCIYEGLLFPIVMVMIIVMTRCCIHVAGVDYHFHREELYLTLSNGTIQRYKINVTGSHTLSIGSLSNQPPTTVYTTVGGNTLGNITVDWLYDIIYWIEFEDSTTKVQSM